MNDVFVIRNQSGHYWGKKKLWVDGNDARIIMRDKHQDEAVNTLVEISSKDIDLRGEVLSAELNARGEPSVKPSATPLPLDFDTPEATSADGPGDNQETPEPPAVNHSQ